MQSRPWFRWAALGGLLLALILAPFILFEDVIQAWTAAHLAGEKVWLLGFLIAGLLASDVFLPIPSSIVSTSAGVLLGFRGALLASTAGMCAGAILGYAFGAAGGRWLRRFTTDAGMQRAITLSRKYGAAALIVSRPIPGLAEASVVCAGLMRMPLAKFLVLTALSNLGISAAYASVGALSYHGSSFLLSLLGAITIPAAAIGISRLLGWRR